MSEIELVLKSPTDRVAPFSVKCVKTWNVRQVKEYIHDVYPCKLLLDSQKLIYSGKLLKDDQILSDIFENETSAIVHFICKQFVTNDVEMKEANQKLDSTSTPDPELYKEYQNYLNSFYSASMQSFTSMDQYNQMMWLNNAYLQSYATYYNQLNNTTDNINTSDQCSEVVQRTVTNDTPSQENPPNNNERRIEPAGDNGMQNMMAAALGGLMGDGGEDENDGDVEPRDILHYFYMFIRFGLLLLICYYYSSMFSVVTTLMLFLIFFGVNFFRQNNHANQLVNIVVPENGEIPVQAAPPVEEASVNPLTTDVPATPSPPPSPSPPLSPGVTDRLRQAASTSIQFVFTFFITLFPDPVAHINVN